MAEEFLRITDKLDPSEVNKNGFATYIIHYSKSISGKTTTDLQNIFNPNIQRDGSDFSTGVRVDDPGYVAKLPATWKTNYEFIAYKDKQFYWAGNYADAIAGKWTAITKDAEKSGMLANPNEMKKLIEWRSGQVREQGEEKELQLHSGEGTSNTLVNREGNERTGGFIPVEFAQYLPSFDSDWQDWFNPKHKNFWWLFGTVTAVSYYRNRKSRRIARKVSRKTSRRTSRKIARRLT